MRDSNIIQRWLLSFPLWPLLSGVISGILVAEYFAALNGITTNLASITSITSIVSIACVLIFRSRELLLFIVSLLLALGIHGPKIAKLGAWEYFANSEQAPPTCTLEGVVISTGSKGNGPYLVDAHVLETKVETNSLPETSGLKILLKKPFFHRQKLKYGDAIKTSGIVEPIQPARNPYAFNQQAWLYRQGVNLSITTQYPVVISHVSVLHRPLRFMADWRQSVRKSITSGLDANGQSAQLIRAVVLGERPERTSTMIEDFRNSGTLHVFAVSGLHVGMVGTIFACLLWFMRAPRWLLISGIIIAMTAYAATTGLRPPSVRAVIMATVFLTGFLLRRKPTLINSLAASAMIVLLWDGHQLFTPGFQLSYGVLLALALATTFWIRVLKPMAEIDPFMPRLLLSPWQERVLGWKKWLRNSLAVSMAAWVGSAPLIWIHFGILTPIAVIAGIPLMLMVFVILALAMLSISAGALWLPAGETLNQLNSWIAKSTYHTAATFARIPGSHWHQKPQRPRKGQIIVFDIPNGGAAHLIDAGAGILLDSGRDDTFRRHVLPALEVLKINPDSLIISHADSKHSGGMSACLDHFSPKQALIPRIDSLSKSYRHFIEKSRHANCHLITPHTGQKFAIEPGVSLEILHAPAELHGKGRADDSGLVILLRWHDWKIMFTGDAGFITETRLLASGINLEADVIISGRNRTDFTGREAFYQAVSPQLIISTHAEFPENEQIPKSWFELTESLNIMTVDQQQSGAVTLTIQDQKLILTPTLPSAQTITLKL
ncbi:MAG: ComEC/Rec2 family competence protein [Akkermansiaceae bacterium]|nr:ComEC/Rec2 family competence protein [Akkermansiaceae bacterium]